MSGKHAPRGLWIAVALALLMGVGLPSSAWAEVAGDDDGSGLFNPPRGGNSGGAGGSGSDGEADPDWWQTDVWAGAQIGALPAPDSPREPDTRRVVRYVESPIQIFVYWLQALSRHHLGF